MYPRHRKHSGNLDAVTFNVDGKYVYAVNVFSLPIVVMPIDTTTRIAGPPIVLPSAAYSIAYQDGIAGNRDPQPGSP